MDRLCHGPAPVGFRRRLVCHGTLGPGSDDFDARRSTRSHARAVGHLVCLPAGWLKGQSAGQSRTVAADAPVPVNVLLEGVGDHAGIHAKELPRTSLPPDFLSVGRGVRGPARLHQPCPTRYRGRKCRRVGDDLHHRPWRAPVGHGRGSPAQAPAKKCEPHISAGLRRGASSRPGGLSNSMISVTLIRSQSPKGCTGPSPTAMP